MLRALITILSLYFVVAGLAQERKPDFLDLTKEIPPQRKRPYGRGGGASGGTLHGYPPKIIPVKVTLLSLDKGSYQLGDQMIFEVLLENMTNDVLVIPWSRDYDKVKPDEDRDPRGYVTASVMLVMKWGIAGDQSMAGQVVVSGAGQGIFGSKLLRGSLKSLSPGQKVRIRAGGRWAGFSDAKYSISDAEVYGQMLAKLPRTFEVSAQFQLTETRINPRYEPAISTNSLAVELRKRQQ